MVLQCTARCFFRSIGVDVAVTLCEAKEVDSDEHSYLAAHRSHDVGLLLKRWHLVAGKADLQVALLEKGEPHPVIALHNNHSVSGNGLYLSAGIHGDEPAAVQGLLEWAEKNVQLLRGRPVTIFPCLNPWGLDNNRREDAEGRDLNRSFDLPAIPVIGAMLELLSERKFAVAVSLHEALAEALSSGEEHLSEVIACLIQILDSRTSPCRKIGCFRSARIRHAR